MTKKTQVLKPWLRPQPPQAWALRCPANSFPGWPNCYTEELSPFSRPCCSLAVHSLQVKGSHFPQWQRQCCTAVERLHSETSLPQFQHPPSCATSGKSLNISEPQVSSSAKWR